VSLLLSAAGAQDFHRTEPLSVSFPNRRELQQDDFAELNAILQNVVIEIPEDPPTLTSGGVTMDLYNVVCQDLKLSGASLSSRRISSRDVELQVTLSGLDFTCQSRYRYTGALGVTGRGDVIVYSRGNQAVATATVSSTSATLPPTNVVMNSCNPTIQIVDIDFANGGIISWVLDAVEGLLRDTMERLAQQLICSELQKALQGQTKEFLSYAKKMLDRYSSADATVSKDALLAREQKVEQSIPLDSDVQLLNLQEQDTNTGKWIHQALNKGVEYLNAMVDTPSGSRELQVNRWLRDYVLDTDGALVLEQPDNGMVVYEGHDVVTQTTIVLDRVKLVGLDTFTQFDPFEMPSGNYTLHTNMAWEYLALEIDATVTIRPSTLDSSIIVDSSSGSSPVVEQVSAFVGIRDLVASSALLTAIDQTVLEGIRLGSLLSTDYIMDCFMSTLYELEWASMTVDAADVLTPTISGLVSRGIDRVLSQGFDAAFLMYETHMLRAAPAYFQQEIRPMLNQNLLRGYFLEDENGNSRHCLPILSWLHTGNVDFRDLLLTPEEALAVGGSGNEPYGDLFSSLVMPYLQEKVLEPTTLNTAIVGSLTKEQSGTQGMLEFANVFEYQQLGGALYDYLDFKVSKVKITNLDKLVDPLLLQPTDANRVLNSIGLDATTGTDDGLNAVNVTARVMLDVGGIDSPLQMKNEVEFSVAIPSASLSIEFLANLKKRSLLEFPLEDVTNLHCWLAALATVEEMSKENQEQMQQTTDLAVSALSFSFSTFFLDSTCITSSSPGCQSVSEVLHRLQQAGLVSLFRESIILLVEDIILSFWDGFDVQALVDAAPTYCPHSDRFNPQVRKPVQELPKLSGFSSNTSETILALGTIAVEAAVVISAKNQLLLAEENPGESTSASSAVPKSFPAGSDILDWQNLSARWGSWIDITFDEFRNYLSTPVDRKKELRKRTAELTPRINLLLQEYILDQSGAMVVDMDGLSLTALGFSISATKAQITGLDTITSINPLVVLSSNTLASTAHLEALDVAIDFDVTTLLGTTEQMRLKYAFKEVDVQIDTKVALNTTKVGHTQLGSIFDVSHIDNCLLKGVQAFEISKLNITAKEVAPSSIEGYFSEHQATVSTLVESLHSEYQSDIVKAMPLMIDSTIREMINALIPDILQTMTSGCPDPPQFKSDGLVDFRDFLLSEFDSEKLEGSGNSPYGNLFSLLYDVLEKEVMMTGASSRPVLNDLLATMTEKQSNVTGTIRVAGKAVDSQTTIQVAGLTAELGIQVSDVLIQNLDSIGDPLHLFQPVRGTPNVLNNTISFGVDPKPLTFAATLTIALSDGAEMNIRNEVNVSLFIDDVSVQTAFLVQVLENSISSFPFEDFSNWNCWLSTIQLASDGSAFDGIKIVDQTYSSGNFSMDISCNSCTSPDFDDLLMSLYAPSDVSAAIQEQTSSLLDAGFLQTILENLVFDSKKRCPHHPDFDLSYVSQTVEDPSVFSSLTFGLSESGESEKPMHFNIASTFIAVCLCVVGVLGKLMVARRNKKWMRSLTYEGGFFLSRQEENQKAMEKWLDEHTTSLVLSPYISKSVRWSVPIAILLNIGFFLGGHLGMLSVVNLDATLAGESFTINSFMEFTFLESTKRTYENGGKEMVILIWLFTGIWPYVKLILSLLVWITPTSRLGVKRRGQVLLWVDALAKLSVVDIFTMILGVAVLLVFIGGPDESLKSDGVYYALKAVVVPKVGFYCIIIAQRMSRVSSRFLLEYHENVVKEATRLHREMEGELSVSQVVLEECSSNIEIVPPSVRVTRSDDVEENFRNEQPLCENERGTHGESLEEASLDRLPSDATSSSSTWKDYRWGLWGAVLGFITILLIFTIGCIFAPAIAFDVSSIGGIALESGKTYEEAVSEYGVFVVVSAILVRAKFVLDSKVDYIGLGLLLAAAGISVSLIFVIQSYHFIKRKLHERRKRREKTEGPSYGHKGCGLPSYFRLFKWNHMEIFLISFAIGVWQLGSISSYSIYLYCDIMSRIYDVLTMLGIVDASTAQCFNEQASDPGNLIIILGAFGILLVSFCFEASAQYKKNIAHCMKYVNERDVPRLSLAWSRDKSKNSRYSHLTESLSLSNIGSSRQLSSSPGSPSLSRVSSATSGSATAPTWSPRPSIPPDSPAQQSFLDDDLEVTSCPVASPCSVQSSNGSGHSSVIDAPCSVVASPTPRPSWRRTTQECDDGTSGLPPLVPCRSLEEESHEEASSSHPSLTQPSSPRRLSSFLRGLAARPRRSLPLPVARPMIEQSDSGTGTSLSRPRRARSTDDIVRYVEENPDRFD